MGGTAETVEVTSEAPQLKTDRADVSVEFTGKLATGWVHQEVRIDGFSTTQTGTAPPQVFPNQSILLVQPTNAGRESRNALAVVPSAEARVAVNLWPWLSVSAGYQFLYWSSVARPGGQVDPAVNTTQSPILGGGALVGEARPAPLFDRSDFFAHGVSL